MLSVKISPNIENFKKATTYKLIFYWRYITILKSNVFLSIKARIISIEGFIVFNIDADKKM